MSYFKRFLRYKLTLSVVMLSISHCWSCASPVAPTALSSPVAMCLSRNFNCCLAEDEEEEEVHLIEFPAIDDDELPPPLALIPLLPLEPRLCKWCFRSFIKRLIFFLQSLYSSTFTPVVEMVSGSMGVNWPLEEKKE